VPFQVIPKEHAFFDLFQQAAGNVVAAARELAALTEDLAEGDARAARGKALEHEGDEVTHRILALLNTTFVTTFDREDIYRLASRLDDVLDATEAVADLLVLHRVEEPLPELHQQAGVLVRTMEVVERVIVDLRSLQGLKGYLLTIDRLE